MTYHPVAGDVALLDGLAVEGTLVLAECALVRASVGRARGCHGGSSKSKDDGDELHFEDLVVGLNLRVDGLGIDEEEWKI